MNALLPRISAISALCLLLASCAQTGAPLPPSLELPKPPTDLRATRKGNRVTLTWSEPTLTTDRQSVRYLGPTLICRSTDPDMSLCGNPIQIVPPPSSDVSRKAGKSTKKTQPRQPAFESYVDALPSSIQSENPEAEVTYSIEVLNRNARGAGLSNRVHVPAITTLSPPSDPAAKLTGDGVLLMWTSGGEPRTEAGVEYRYRIYRRAETTAHNADRDTAKNKEKDVIAGEVPVGPAGPAHFLDGIEWEKTYLYWITAVTIVHHPGSEVQVEGDDTPVVRVVAHDIFPPSVPAGLQAVYSGEGQKPFIDLIWAPVTSADLAGYNVYRREASGSPIKLNSEPVRSPSYRDSKVDTGKTYIYSVSAVDLRGNESARSEEASETLP